MQAKIIAFLWSIIDFLQNYNGAVTALATVAIGIFTYFLVRVTNRQAKLTSKSVEIAEAALIKLERAFVFIDGFNVELTTALDSGTEIESLPERYRSDPGLYITRFAVQPTRWKNGGNPPTERMTIQADWRGPPGPIPPDYAYRNPPAPLFLAPKAVEPSAIIEMPSAPLLVEWSWRPVGVEPMVFIWGRADYEDVFGRKHFVEWCYKLRF